jgi:hypothetical protein
VIRYGGGVIGSRSRLIVNSMLSDCRHFQLSARSNKAVNPAKRLIGAKSADLASQSGRNWLSSGGHSRLWLIKSALKDKGSAFRQPFALPEFQSDQLKEDAACRFSFAITMSIKP